MDSDQYERLLSDEAHEHERLHEAARVARVDRDMDIVDRLRLGGPNAMEVVDQAADEIEKLRLLLSQIDTTMCMHGKVDAGTDLHDRIQRAYGVE